VAGEVNITVVEQEHFWRVECSRQCQNVRLYDHTPELAWRHLNVFEHRCNILCRVPRGVRPDGKVYRVDVPWEGLCKHFTSAFEAMALMLIREMPVAAAARIIKETDTRLWRMVKAHVEAAYDLTEYEGVTCVGCDEMSARKGHRYVTVFCDMVGHKVIFACDGKDASTWDRFVVELERHNGHRADITEASMDMSPAYVKGVECNCKNAKIVFDKFHVVAHVNDAVDTVRREEMRKSDKKDKEDLKGSRWNLLKNIENLTPKQRARHDGLLKKTYASVKAYQMRLVFQHIYSIEDVGEARRKFLSWSRWVKWVAAERKDTLFDSMVSCAKMVESHIEGILGYWRRKTTNAFLEGLNSVFSAVKRAARGFRTTTNLITMLYFHAAKLKIPVPACSHSK
jgi:transposase